MTDNEQFQFKTAVEQTQKFALQLSEHIHPEVIHQALVYAALRADMDYSKNQKYSIANLLAVISPAIEHDEQSQIKAQNNEVLTLKKEVPPDTH